MPSEVLTAAWDAQLGLLDELAIVLAFALAGGLIASRLRVPAIVGYLAAGLAIGPFTPGFVADAELADQLGEIGIVLLMFGVGLHFSIAELMKVRRVAVRVRCCKAS
ncbi:MAG: cation:proton antiporter [Vicinamibacterales bacterium]